MSEDNQVAAVLMEQKQPMTRTLGVERVFTLGNYQTIRFIDTVDNIPEELAFNADLVNKIRALQFVSLEKNYREYVKVHEKVNSMSLEDAITALNKDKATSLEEIQTILTKKKEE